MAAATGGLTGKYRPSAQSACCCATPSDRGRRADSAAAAAVLACDVRCSPQHQRGQPAGYREAGSAAAGDFASATLAAPRRCDSVPSPLARHRAIRPRPSTVQRGTASSRRGRVRAQRGEKKLHARRPFLGKTPRGIGALVRAPPAAYGGLKKKNPMHAPLHTLSVQVLPPVWPLGLAAPLEEVCLTLSPCRSRRKKTVIERGQRQH